MDDRGRNLWWVWVIVGVVVLAALGGGAALLLNSNNHPTAGASVSPSAPASVTPTPTRTATAPATASAAATATASATSTATVTPTATASPAQPAVTAVTPFISYAGWDSAAQGLSVSASVPQIVESDGSCVVTATKGDARVTATFSATPAASSTDCGSNSLTSPDFTSGTWSVVVRYSSSSSSGSSAPSQVDIP